MKDIQFHILDVLTRDQVIVSEHDEGREVYYDDDFDDERATPVSSADHARATPNRREMIIHLFGRTAGGQNVRIDVGGFKPFFYVRIPSFETRGAAMLTLKEYIKKQAKLRESDFRLVFEQRQPFYGFTAGGKFPFVKIELPSMQAFRNVKNLFLNKESKPQTRSRLAAPFGGVAPEVYETSLDPMLRFFHLRDIQPCGWATISGIPEPEDEEGMMEIECDWEEVSPVAAAAVAPFTIVSWDIECFSATGDFPRAIRGFEKTGKELYLLATDEESCIELVLDAFGYGRGRMTPAPLKSAPPSKERILQIVNPIASALAANLKQAGHMAADRDEAMAQLAKQLNKSFGGKVALGGDPIIQIGVSLARTGSENDRERHMFVFPSCSAVEGIEVHEYKTEREMILGFAEWLVECDPDILVGYNVFGFDERYLFDRCTLLGIDQDDAIQGMNRLNSLGGELKCEEKRLSSSALGDNIMYVWSAQGHLQVDLYQYVKRTITLESYKLDNVAKHFMRGKLKTVPQLLDGTNLNLTLAGAVVDAKLGRAIVLLDEDGEEVSQKLTVVAVGEGGQVEVSGDLGDEWEDATHWVIVKDDVSPQDIFRLHTGDADDRAIVAKYCLQDCDLVLDLYRKLDVFNNAMAMANVCSVPVGYIFMRGQGIKIESLMFKEAYAKGQAIITLPQPARYNTAADDEPKEDSYEGAIVLKPMIGLHDSPVGVADFASLYPSTIVSENISHDMLVWVKDYDMEGNYICTSWGSEEYDRHPDYRYTDIEFDILRPDPKDTRKDPKKIKMGMRVCRYAQPADQVKGTVPQIIQKLLAARKATRVLAAKESDPLKAALLDTQQNAYKITANSLYGQLGSGTFKIRLQHLAASVTGYGRKQIMFAKAVIEELFPGAITVYGDTDSLFVKFKPIGTDGTLLTGRDARIRVIELTGEAGHLVSQALKSPHDFEFDKVYDPLLLFSKKRYAGKMYENENKPDSFCYKYMGLALKRRGNAPIVKKIYGKAMEQVLDFTDVPGAADMVREGCRELVDGKVSMALLTVTKSLSAEYKNPSSVEQKVLADRIAARDPGNAPAPGERVGFAYVLPPVGQLAAKLQGDRIETPTYIKEKGLRMDYKHYILKQISSPISQMFGILLENMKEYTKGMLPENYEDLDFDKQMVLRERIASQLLFDEALRICEGNEQKVAKRVFFGKATVMTEPAFGKATVMTEQQEPIQRSQKVLRLPPTRANPQLKQAKIDSFFSDTAMLMLIKAKKKAAAAVSETA